MADKPRTPRDLLSLGLLILVALSLVFAASQLLRGAGGVLPAPPLDLKPTKVTRRKKEPADG